MVEYVNPKVRKRLTAQTRRVSRWRSFLGGGENTEVTVAGDPSRCAIMHLYSNRKTSTNNATTNKNYMADVARSLQYTRRLLEILGIWPMVKTDPKDWERCASKALISICAILMAFNMIPWTLHTIFVEKDLLVRLPLLGPVGFCLTNILKYCSIIFRRRTIKCCMEHMKADWMRIGTENDREIMIRSVDEGRRLTVICATFMYTGGIAYVTIMPLWRGNEINEYNETVRPLAYPGYDIFIDSQKSPYYEIIFITNCISSCVLYTITTATCNLAATFVAHACGHIGITTSRLDAIFDEVDDGVGILKDRIDFVVMSHVRVLRLTSLIETLLREICLVEVVAAVVIICVLAYCCLMTWNDSDTVANLTYFALLVSLIFNIFIFCYIGELLEAQCSHIGHVAYMMDWYRLPGKTGSALIMIIAMSHYPRKLTAGRMIDLSISSFGSILKSSMVYLNMLRTMAA